MSESDIGYGGSYSPNIVNESALDHLRNLAGPAPTDGKKFIMVNLFSGEMHWYRSTNGGKRTYTRRKK